MNQCICHFVNPIRKADNNKNLCLNVQHPNYSWVYKGKIPAKKVKVRLVLQILFKLYPFNSFKHKFDRMNTSSNMFIKNWKRVGYGLVFLPIRFIFIN